MRKLLSPMQIKMMLPYFFLALAVIISFQIISDLSGQESMIIGFIGRVWGIISPFFYGFLLAYILSIPAAGFQKLIGRSKIKFLVKRKKAISIFIVYIGFFSLIYLLLDLVIPYIVDSVALFIANSQSYYERILEFIDQINYMNFLNEPIYVETILSDWFAELGALGLEDLARPFDAIFGLTATLFRGFLAFISSIYILFEKDKFKAFLCRIIGLFSSNENYNIILKYSHKINSYFKRYIYTQTIDGCILGTAVGFQLYLLGSPFALTLGILLGIVNYIPYFGSIVGTLVAVIVVAFTQGAGAALVASITLIVTQQLDANVLQPRLMGESFKLSPLLVIISITIGGAFAGMLGMIAAIPIVAVLRDILDDIFAYLEAKKAGKHEKIMDYDEYS
ncbi:MAG: AI-2E family transporter [Defluviitaleaceae bacterium]|nr:AI-2E family transporter [Defluviitaleaceae bacterium]